jgi:hypothetical protein
MKILLKLMLLALFIMLGGVALIKILGRHSWQESFEIADQFMAELLS